jgi:bis(5'-nucleosyl)-tetraphosphatase (symmetrical)
MHYLVGDIQGCASALDRLLDEIAFSPSRDHLYVLGDLVNRGPGSLATLRRLRGLGAAASCVLGNHDWHLLAVAAGVRPRHRSDTLDDILDAPDREDWLAWVRTRRMAVFEQGWLMLHAGVVPQWDLADDAPAGRRARAEPAPTSAARIPGRHVRQRAGALERLARRRRAPALHAQYPHPDPLRRRRRHARVPDQGRRRRRAAGFPAWFDVPGRRTAGVPIAFGHWSSLGLVERNDLLGLDTGCVWGGRLTAVRIDADEREVFHVGCAPARVSPRRRASAAGH